MDVPPPLPPEIAAQDKGPTILWSIWSLSIATTIFVAARLFVRLKLLKNQGLDDYLIVFSTVCNYIYVGFTTASVKAGNGRHSLALDPKDLERANMLNMAGFPAGVMSFCTPKLAVVALLVRILNPSIRHRIFLWSLTGFTTVYLVVCFLILYIQCDPPRALWDYDLQMSGDFTCWDSKVLVNMSIAGAALSATVDLYLAVYPATVLWGLQMYWKKKLALSVALGFGCCATAISIYKCTKLPALGDKLDATYTTADLVIWACIEGNALIIAACIPTLAPLVEFIMRRKIFQSTGFGRYYKGGRANNSGQPSAGVEFANIGVRRQTPKKPTDTSLSWLDTKTGSQENILQADEARQTQRSPSGGDNSESFGVEGIRRTDEVEIEYGSARDMQPNTSTKQGAIWVGK